MGLKSWLGNRICRKHSGNVVMTGPFKGLKYIEDSIGSAYSPKILGTYELELHTAVEEIIANAPGMIVDVGAAEGYYAVGLASRLPDTRVTAFEAEARGRELLGRLARLNGVSTSIDIQSTCTPENLQAFLETHPEASWLIMDVEGAEQELLDPDRIPALHRMNILVEVHEQQCPGISQLLLDRFCHHHQIQTLHQQQRTLDELPTQLRQDSARWPNAVMLKAMDEKRGYRMHWLLMKPTV